MVNINSQYNKCTHPYQAQYSKVNDNVKSVLLCEASHDDGSSLVLIDRLCQN